MQQHHHHHHAPSSPPPPQPAPWSILRIALWGRLAIALAVSVVLWGLVLTAMR